LEAHLEGIKKISYAPAGKLYAIAFHALPVDSSGILADHYQLEQYISTRQLAFRNDDEKPLKGVSVSLFGDASFSMDSLQLTRTRIPRQNDLAKNTTVNLSQIKTRGNGVWIDLPGTATEVNQISKLFAAKNFSTHLFVRESASEENLKKLDRHAPPLLHIATHGFFLPELAKATVGANTYRLATNPLLRSGIVLAGGNYAWSGKKPIDGVEDGIVTAYEISQLNLSNTELVVLSACETALGDVKGSEGVFGLQRAFKMAGVKRMIVSLWQVPDKETAELMTSFYTNCLGGMTIKTAFAQAQLAMRKKYSAYYWAAFVLVE
jgi:CHAT domain-containing protein